MLRNYLGRKKTKKRITGVYARDNESNKKKQTMTAGGRGMN